MTRSIESATYWEGVWIKRETHPHDSKDSLCHVVQLDVPVQPYDQVIRIDDFAEFDYIAKVVIHRFEIDDAKEAHLVVSVQDVPHSTVCQLLASYLRPTAPHRMSCRGMG
jgi:hypothetical protein